MKLSVAVMAHPNRTDLVQKLLCRLQVPPGVVPVAWDDEGPPRRDPDRVWRTCRRAWELRDPDADWHLVLQDDAIPCEDLLAGAAAALGHVPDKSIVSLYMGAGTPLPRLWGSLAGRARAEGASWIVGPRSTWGVGLALPTAAVPEMLEFCDRQGAVPDDMRIGRWARRRGYEAWFPFPSLVDHDDSGGSLVGHHLVRRAYEHLRASAVHDWDPGGPVVRHGR